MNGNPNRKFTVSVGIPAYNEEKNILQLLESLTKQKGDNFILEKITVISDGSLDRTPALVEAYGRAHPEVVLIAYGESRGQAARLNEFYRNNTSDILVTLDADCCLKDGHVLSELARQFNDPAVGLAGGNDQPSKPENFFERIAVASINLWYEIRRNINGGDCVYNHHGCISAVSKELGQKVEIPKGLAAADTYLFFKARQLGFAFRFAEKAVVYYHAPDNWRDFEAQTRRFWESRSQITGQFGTSVAEQRRVPLANKLSGLVKAFFHEPVFLPLALLLRLRLKFAKHNRRNPEAVWARIDSTKREFNKIP